MQHVAVRHLDGVGAPGLGFWVQAGRKHEGHGTRWPHCRYS
jgi:hypothetical protein